MRCIGTCGASRRKVDDPEVFGAALVEAGLQPEQIFDLNQTKEVKDRLLENTQRSVERGPSVSPTFYVGDEIFFGKDRLRDVEEMIIPVEIAGGPSSRSACVTASSL